MAFITLSGTLLDPNGDLAVGDQIRFTHNSSTGQTVESAVSIITINPAGTYSLPLQYGLVLVEYKCVRSQQFKNLGVATVNGTNTSTSIPELLNALVPVSSAELIEFQAILADCVAAKVAAEAAAATIDLINDLSLTYKFGSILSATGTSTTFPVEKVIKVSENITGNGGGADWIVKASGTVNGTYILSMDNFSTVLEINTNFIDTDMFGVLSSGNMSSEMVLISNYANIKNINTINISVSTLQLDSDVDCKGAIVSGNNTVISGVGRFVNTAKQNGIILNSQNSIFNARHPSLPAITGNFAINKVSANEYSFFAQKQTKGYLLMSFKNNVTTPTQSLAASTSDATSLRNVSSVNLVDCIVGFQGSGATVGTWASTNMITGIDEAFTGGIEYTYEFASGAVSKEYTVIVGDDGYFNIGFLRSSSSTTAAVVAVDGVDIETGINLTVGATSIEFREYKALPGSRVIKVSSPANRLNLLGVNVFKLKNYREGFVIDKVGYYTNSTNYDNYLSNTSANDYAILEKTSDIFGGSYHGGETSINTKIIADGSAVSLSNGESLAAKSVQIVQDFGIDWTSVSGPLLNVDTSHTFIKGGYSFQSTFTNTITVESFFGTLFGISEDFSEITSPKRFDITSIASGDRVFYGQQNQVTYSNPVTDQKIKITHTSFDNYENEKGGAYTWRVVGLYNKYYAPFIDRGNRTVNDLSFTNIFEFL